MKKSIMNPALGLLGATLLGGSVSALSWAGSSPFAVSELQGGYQLAQADKAAEGKCGEGKCGANKANSEKMKDGSCGGDMKAKEGKCGGANAKMKEGSCGGASKAGDMKAKEGKCGGTMK